MLIFKASHVSNIDMDMFLIILPPPAAQFTSRSAFAITLPLFTGTAHENNCCVRVVVNL